MLGSGRIALSLALLSVFILSPAPRVQADGAASPPPQAGPPSDADAEARRAFEAGRQAYDSGDFADALARFEQAHRLSPRPELLYNIGRAADSDGQFGRATAAYAAYLEAFPLSPNRAFVEARLEKTRALERMSTVSAAPAGSASVLPPVTEPPAAPVSVLATAPGQPARSDAVETARPVWRRAWFWTAIGAVVAGGVTAAVVATRDDDPARAEADVYAMTGLGR